MDKRWKYVKPLIQLVAVFWIPALFADILGACKTLVAALAQGQFQWEYIKEPVFLLGGLIALTVCFGRFFCGFFCSFGAMQDLLWFLSSRIMHRKKGDTGLSNRLPAEKERFLKKGKYVVLIVCLALAIMGVSLDSWSPWSVFGRCLSFWKGFSTESLMTVGAVLLALIMVGAIVDHRFFCKYLCPSGAILSIFASFHVFQIKKPRTECGSCHLCSQGCEARIPLQDMDCVAGAECTRCMACVSHCPKKNARFGQAWLPALALALTAAGIFLSQSLAYGLFLNDSAPETPEALLESNQESSEANQEQTSEDSRGPYTDGVYQGKAEGYRGWTELTVTVENGYISSVTIDDYDDDKSYFRRAEEPMIQSILEQQSTEVDTVSGATYSCKGILHAVEDALQLGDQEPSAEETTSAAETIASDQTFYKDVADGVYMGIGNSFRGPLTVCVTVEAKRVTDLYIVSYYDNWEYLEMAYPTVIQDILDNQTLEVDAVSGATYSTNGIIRATANALGIPESELQLHEGRKLSSLHKKHGHVVKKYLNPVPEGLVEPSEDNLEKSR